MAPAQRHGALSPGFSPIIVNRISTSCGDRRAGCRAVLSRRTRDGGDVAVNQGSTSALARRGRVAEHNPSLKTETSRGRKFSSHSLSHTFAAD